MCLSTVLKRYQTVLDDVKTGFKVLEEYSRDYYRVPVINQTYRYDQWSNATGQDIRADDGTYYPSGFHIFSRYNDAVSYRDRHHPNCFVAQVEYSHITTRGTQDGYKVSVAKKMCVLNHDD